MRRIIAFSLLTLSLGASARAAEPVTQVMIVGTFHMSNPGRDLANVHADDMLSPQRQGEIAAVTEALARFKPNYVGVEWDAPLTDARYAAYRAHTLAPSHNEVVQLGFRLADAMALEHVHGLDIETDFPFEAVQAYAKAHDQDAVLDGLMQQAGQAVNVLNEELAHGSVGDVLRFMNDRREIAASQNFYRETLRIGGGNDQPGAALLTAWFGRNAQICAHLIQSVKPGGRAVVFYGAGHAFYLRQCVSEMPGFKLVEADDYLPR